MNIKPRYIQMLSSFFLLFGSVVFVQNGYANDVSSAASKFNDPQLLIDTLTADDNQDVEDALFNKERLTNELSLTEDDLQQAIDSGTASDEEIQALEDKIATLNLDIEQAEEDLTMAEQTAEDELIAIAEQVEQLSDEQVTSMNQKLNNTVAKGLLVDIDSDDLQMVIDGDYNSHQINAFTKAFEEEAKFQQLARKFAEKEDDDDDKFLDQIDKMLEKSNNKREQFLAKIDEFDGKGIDSEAKVSTQLVAVESVKNDAKDFAKNDSKILAKNAAKQAFKENIQNAAKNDVKDKTRVLAVRAVKEEHRNAKKGGD